VAEGKVYRFQAAFVPIEEISKLGNALRTGPSPLTDVWRPKRVLTPQNPTEAWAMNY
jgi:hypothetical protein